MIHTTCECIGTEKPKTNYELVMPGLFIQSIIKIIMYELDRSYEKK